MKCCHLVGFISEHIVNVTHVSTMPARRRMNNFGRRWVIVWLQDHICKCDVARQFDILHSVTCRFNQCFLATMRVQERLRSGCPNQTTNQEDCFIQGQALQMRTASSSIIQTQLQVVKNTNMSSQTIRNHLHAANLCSHWPAVQPWQMPTHMAARLTFCSGHHVKWTCWQWAQFIYSDESCFSLHHNDAWLHV